MTIQRKKRLPLIKYVDRDFDSIKKNLRDHRRRYYSDISQDENEASFDEMMEDLVSYVGDQLHYYHDYSVNESFLQTAIEYNNILKHGKSLGYKFKGNPSSIGAGQFYIIVDANATGLGPDTSYLPVLKRGSEFATTAGVSFILNEDVRFDNENNEVRVARVDETTGIPTAYAIKAEGEVISGKFAEELITIGEFQKFYKVELSGRDIAEIISVTDEEGVEYYEVEFLSDDVVFKEVQNRGADMSVVPLLLKPFVVPRRFVVERDRTKTTLQFGAGSDTDTQVEPLLDPSQVVLNVFGKTYITDQSFDPSNLLGTDKLGIAPANTTLRVVYRVNSSDNVNAPAGTMVSVTSPIFEFENVDNLSVDSIRAIINSLECTNEKSIIGDVSFPSITELKIRVSDTFAAQNRAVTPLDYVSACYQMPPRFGSIKRVSIYQDNDSFKRNLNLYVVSENADGTLEETSDSIKQNLRQWLLRKKMINDTIDILDATILNLGINFVISAEPETNKYDVLQAATARLQEFLQQLPDIGENFPIRRVYDILNSVSGVDDVIRVDVAKKTGTGYSTTRFNVKDAISADGRFVEIPSNVIWEVKYPRNDIKGSVE